MDTRYWEGLRDPATFLADDRNNPARSYAAARIDRFMACHPVATMVEVGPGSGYDLADHFMPLIKRGLHYTGVEPTNNLRLYLQDTYRHPLIHFVPGSFDSLQVKGFDISYTKAVFEHLPDYKEPIVQFIKSARYMAIINWYRPPAKKDLSFDALSCVHYNTYDRDEVFATINGLYYVLETAKIGTNEVWVLQCAG